MKAYIAEAQVSCCAWKEAKKHEQNSHGKVSIANDRDTQGLGEVGRLVLVHTCLDDISHCTNVPKESAY